MPSDRNKNDFLYVYIVQKINILFYITYLTIINYKVNARNEKKFLLPIFSYFVHFL